MCCGIDKGVQVRYSEGGVRRELKVHGIDEWLFSSDTTEDRVWFHFNVGAIFGGLHMTPEQARELAVIIIAAVDELEGA